MFLQDFTISSSFQPRFSAIALFLDHMPAAALEKFNFRKIAPAGNLRDSLLGLLAFMNQLQTDFFRTRSSPLAAMKATEDLYAIFWAGEWLGGFYSLEQVHQLEAANPKNLEQILKTLAEISPAPNPAPAKTRRKR